MKTLTKTLTALYLIMFAASCVGPSGSNASDRRAAVLDMRSETLQELYRLEPQARREIDRAVGYGVFSNIGVNVVLASLGNGYGVVQKNGGGEPIYMRMVSGGLGIGLGVKDFRGIFVFTDVGAMQQFVDHGWDASAQADAAAIAGDKGAAFAGAIDVAPGIKLYQITENGLALQATVQGTKYWRDDDLTSPRATLTGS
jgi:lipid-binding SYLF domain-containing protein